MNDVTRILSAIEQGDPHAAEQLLPLVYDELRKLAAAKLAQEKPGQTLQATALVHEAYLRLVGVDGNSRSTGTAAATSSPPRPRPCGASSSTAPAASRRDKHGGGRQRGRPRRRSARRHRRRRDDLLALDEALDELAAEIDPSKAELVKLRLLRRADHRGGGRGCSASRRATADRHWAYARAWLRRELAVDADVRA